jgi:hypothetical protein
MHVLDRPERADRDPTFSVCRTIEKILLSAPYADVEKPRTRPIVPIASESRCLLMGIFRLVIDLIVTSEMARLQGAWPIKGNSKNSRALSPTCSFAAILRLGITAVNQVHDAPLHALRD